MLVVVGQPAAVLAQCVGRRYKPKLCEQHFGRTRVRTCAQGFREASVSPLSEAVSVSDFVSSVFMRSRPPRLIHMK